MENCKGKFDHFHAFHTNSSAPVSDYMYAMYTIYKEEFEDLRRLGRVWTPDKDVSYYVELFKSNGSINQTHRSFLKKY